MKVTGEQKTSATWGETHGFLSREQYDLSLLQRYGLWVHSSDYNPYKTNSISVTPHLPVSLCCVASSVSLICKCQSGVSIPVLKPSTATWFLSRVCSSSSSELCLGFLSNLFVSGTLDFIGLLITVFSMISVGLSSPCPLRERNEKWYSHFSDGEQKHRKSFQSSGRKTVAK